MYKSDLEKDVVGISSDFQKLMFALAKGRRAAGGSVTDYKLTDPRVKRKGTDVPKWISIMTEQRVCHLQEVFERYKSYSLYD